ncbi:hypothetical protein [Tropicimonas sp. IMCC6043]|uniref:hypothetical protein n=1 Tax=Tropicimonas sp. IMCC6043 TaxID=2510645 RepID=UPI00101BE6AB|nr:hypothetical protein [Tropicimonas sp. IMCC6043]RYH06524.1 hypothetical protein EU800_23585 [Tropicimonas sp. IMCC6043]
MPILRTSKFHHARTQYRADAGGFTLLRLTYGKNGGAIKTATAGDRGSNPAYPDRDRLISAMRTALNSMGIKAHVEIRRDSSLRLFGEISGEGSKTDFIDLLGKLVGVVGQVLGLQSPLRDRDRPGNRLSSIHS